MFILMAQTCRMEDDDVVATQAYKSASTLFNWLVMNNRSLCVYVCCDDVVMSFLSDRSGAIRRDLEGSSHHLLRQEELPHQI